MGNVRAQMVRKTGPKEGDVVVIPGTVNVTYCIDLQRLRAAYGEAFIEMIATTGTGLFGYRFTNNLEGTPAQTINLGSLSGVQRAFHQPAGRRFVVLPPPDTRYLLVYRSSTGGPIRVSAVSPVGPLNPFDLMHVFAEGDSNTSLDAAAAVIAGPFGQWWWQAQPMLDSLTKAQRTLWVRNNAVSGSKWLVEPPTAIITRGVVFDQYAGLGNVNVALIANSTNDINVELYDLAACQAQMRAWCDARIATGKWTHIVPVAIPPQTLDPAKNAIIDAYNAWLPDLIGEGRASAVVPRNPLLDDDQDTTYFIPQTSPTQAQHYNRAGCTLVAAEVARVLASLAIPT